MESRLILVPLAAVLAIVAGGCGGGPGSPGVASLGSGQATTNAAPPAGSAPGASSGGRSGSGSFGLALKTQNGLKFSQCMRAHGVSNFPDPSSDGSIQIGPSSGISPSSSTFQSAQQACQKLIGGGKPPSPADQAKAKEAALHFSACMRGHGITDFPDPVFSNGGVGISIRAHPGSDLNPSSSAFQNAQRACQGFLKVKGKR